MQPLMGFALGRKVFVPGAVEVAAQQAIALVAAGIRRAAALIVTYADTRSALKVLHHAHELRPNLAVIVRTQDDHDLDKLMQAGATEVVPEVIEGSLMLGSHALVLLGVPESLELAEERLLER